jgi:hypothetical protein
LVMSHSSAGVSQECLREGWVIRFSVIEGEIRRTEREQVIGKCAENITIAYSQRTKMTLVPRYASCCHDAQN